MMMFSALLKWDFIEFTFSIPHPFVGIAQRIPIDPRGRILFVESFDTECTQGKSYVDAWSLEIDDTRSVCLIFLN